MRRAFTLIELLVVIAIIAILAAILFPVFAQAKLAAKKSAGMTQMKQIGTAVHIYITDNDDSYPTWNECFAARDTYGSTLYPPPYYPPECLVNGTFAARYHWDSKLSPYVKNGTPETSSWEGVWRSPQRENYVGRSIGINQLVMWKPYGRSITPGYQCEHNTGTSRFTGCYYWLNANYVLFPSQIIFVGDSGSAGRIEPFYFLNGYAERFVPSYVGYQRWEWAQPWRYGKHGANYVFLDSHARYHAGDHIYPNPNHAPTLSFPTAINIALYCSVIKYQAPSEEMRTRLLNFVQTTLGGTCNNL